jgi:hypothetical protein
MTATAHALVGAAITAKIPDPALALSVAFVSHFIFDKLPHWDVMTETDHGNHKTIFIKSTADVLTGFGLVFLFFGASPIIFLGAFAAQLPDWLEIPSLLGFKNKYFHWNYRLQHWVHDIWFNSRLKAPWGIITQLIVILIFLFWALK